MEFRNSTPIDGLILHPLHEAGDQRGLVREFFRESSSVRNGRPWKQINVTESRPGAVRGLHAEPMNKLVGIVHGQGLGVFVDVRPESPTYTTVSTIRLTKGMSVFVPIGVCNGYQSTGSASSQYLYCFDEEWRPDMGGISLCPLDPALGIVWDVPIDPTNRDQISQKDASAPFLATILEHQSALQG